MVTSLIDTCGLRPVESSTREIKSLDGLWRFLPETPNTPSQPWLQTISPELECPVPASYNDIFLHPHLRDHVGKVWYQRRVLVPRAWAGGEGRVYIRVEAATHRGAVYVEDKLITEHEGGYTPFDADITELVSGRGGQEARVTISVDNILSHHTIPPGETKVNDLGKTTQKYWHDFFNYAGLARSVKLCYEPKIRVSDVTVKPDIRGTTGVVNYDVKTTSGAEARIELLDEDRKVVATSSKLSGELEIANARLWQPGNAYLYDLRIRLFDNSKRLIDEYTLPVGIRTVRIEGFQVLINNKPFYFTGYGKHEDTPIKVKGHDATWMVHDYELMKWSGQLVQD